MAIIFPAWFDQLVQSFFIFLLKDLTLNKSWLLSILFQMVEMSGNHSILCNEKLFVPHIDKNKPVTWTFTVASSVGSFILLCCFLDIKFCGGSLVHNNQSRSYVHVHVIRSEGDSHFQRLGKVVRKCEFNPKRYRSGCVLSFIWTLKDTAWYQ